MKLEIYLGDCLEITSNFDSGSFDLIYIDPPFNTGKVQSRKRLKTVRDDQGDRTGFQGKRYKTQVIGESSFDDNFDDFMTFAEPRLREAHRLLSPQGSFFFHIDYRESHYCKVMLDNIFGRESFKNEIVWAYDYGARSKKRWSAKHDNIFGTPRTQTTIPIVTRISTASHIWHPDSWVRIRRRGGRRQPMYGGRQSLVRMAKRRRDTRRRSP